MKKRTYLVVITLFIAMLVIASTLTISITNNMSDTKSRSIADENTDTSNNDDSIFERLRRLLTGEIIDADISESAAINRSKLDGVPSHDHDERYYTQAEVDALLANCTTSSIDIVTGKLLYNENPSYIEDIGFVLDVSDKIPSGFTLVVVTAIGRKVHQMTGAIQDEPPLILYPIVNGTNIEIQVWDASGDEFGGANWPTMATHIEYTLFIKK